MRAEQLRDAVSGIGMTEDMRTAVIRNVKERTEESKTGNGQRKKTGETERMLKDGKARSSKRSKNHGTVWRKNLAVAAAVLVAIGIVAVPVRAFVNSLVRERMEEMTQEEKETYVDTLKEQNVAADGFSREYTKQEAARYQELTKKYQEGTFPAHPINGRF